MSAGSIKVNRCADCGGSVESKGRRPRLRCSPCAAVKERARLREREVARKASRKRRTVYSSDEERAAAKAKQRKEQRAREKLRRQALSAPKRAERAAAAADRLKRELARSEAKRREAAERPWMAHGLSKAERWRIRYHADPEFNLREKMRTVSRKGKYGRLGEAVRDAVKGRRRGTQLEVALGYSVSCLRQHLQRQFTRGMTWERFCAGEIHIDHIIPLSSFDVNSETEMKAAWALTNLQPMWAVDNILKGSARTLLV
jgi:hypothetical protein